MDSHEEAAQVLKRARQLFEEHSKSITGNVWVFGDACDEIKAIWIIKALREVTTGL